MTRKLKGTVLTKTPKKRRKTKNQGLSIELELLKRFEILAKMERRTISNFMNYLIDAECHRRKDDIDEYLKKHPELCE